MPQKNIYKNLLITLTIVTSLFQIKTASAKASAPFEEYETFDYPEDTSPAPGWMQIFSECKETVGCYTINDVTNSDGTKPYWTVKNKRYEIHSTPHSTLTFIRTFPTNWPEDLKNYSVTFDINMKESVNQDRNFTFRYVDVNRWYELHFYSNKIYMDKAFFDTKTNKNKGKNLGEATYPFQPNHTYTFKIKAKDNTFELYDLTNNNNQLLISAVDTPTDSNDQVFLYGPAGPEIGSGANASSNVWFDNIIVNNLDSTPAPSSTPTPTPSPTPPTTKVILAPGMGASWNTDAILNCKLENYLGNWELAPFAEEIYSPIINSLSQNGFDVAPFYYDWRKRITHHAEELEKTINNLSLQEEEKVNFVGHSMGGLVGRAYLEEKGQNSRVDKYISAGSPHQGTALAYPAWYGGEIWNDHLITKIAATLLLKRCELKYPNRLETLRQTIPSFQDLLPTYKFLRDSKTKQLRGVNTNSWLLGSDLLSNTNAQIATLSGFGFDTLSIIKVKEPTRKEKSKGLWEEGKPSGREFSTEGDGTVLYKSSKIETNAVVNFEINQNHGGLISSQEAIDTIVNYLKGNLTEEATKTTNMQNTSEEESALVIITYPASFISIDPQNKPKKDKNNVVSYINPKSGKYKIGILPLDKESTLIIGQFLKDGRYSWKEYKIKGRLPLSKTIEFNQENLNENPLK